MVNTFKSIQFMKQLLIVLLSVSMLIVACKSQEMIPTEEPAVVETVPEPEPEPEPEPIREDIRITEERFEFETTEDEAIHDENIYFVILGSFSYRDNAERFMETLRGQGFTPVILLSETGFHRVSVNSFDEEIPARTRIQSIRSNFPEYHDVWLLIRKP